LESRNFGSASVQTSGIVDLGVVAKVDRVLAWSDLVEEVDQRDGSVGTSVARDKEDGAALRWLFMRQALRSPKRVGC
jgi:hypothetical protein